MKPKQKSYLIAIGAGTFLGLQFASTVPGVTDISIGQELLIKIIAIGAAAGFFLGMIVYSKANPNKFKVETLVACIVACAITLSLNIYRGFVGSEIGLNIIATAAIPFIPMLLIGAYASSIFSKNT